MRCLAMVVLLAFLLLPCPSLAQDLPVAGVRTVEGSVQVVRDGETHPVANGMELHLKDEIFTGSSSSVGIIFKDDTRLSLGPDSQARIEDFLFEPAEARYSFFTRIIKGTAAFISGQICRLSPSSVKVETPMANIGIRGTHFLVQVEEL